MNVFRSFHLRTQLFVLGLLIVTWTYWHISVEPSRPRPPLAESTSIKPCVEVRPELGPYQEAVIKSPGIHCVVVDFWQRRLSDFAGHSGPTPDHDMLAVIADNVTVDLTDHILHSDGHSSGVVAARINSGEKPVPKNIHIQNGVLDLRGLGTGVKVLDNWPMYDVNSPPPKDFPGFRKSGVVLENLLIRTDNVGVMLEGDGNIIRNCVIESGGDSAIMMAGPNGKILNNTIVLTEPLVPTWLKPRSYLDQLINLRDFRRIPRAAIVLHRGTGTVIQGNRIEVKGKSTTRHNIYLTDASTEVQIDSNTIIGKQDSVTLMKGSSAKLRNNTYEPIHHWWEF